MWERSEQKKDCYSTTAVTANPYVTPLYGFEADTCVLVSRYGALTLGRQSKCRELYREYERLGKKRVKFAIELLKQGRVRDLLYGLRCFARRRASKLRRNLEIALRRALSIEMSPEKGSRTVVKVLRRPKKYGIELEEPFLLLVSIMEAHAPYTIRDLGEKLALKAFVEAVLSGRPPKWASRIWSNYPAHAKYAAKRAVEALKPYLSSSLVIVTSDHDELLGDGGVHHSYFPRDGSLKVPLWVKLGGSDARLPTGRVVSLTELPRLIRAASAARRSS